MRRTRSDRRTPRRLGDPVRRVHRGGKRGRSLAEVAPQTGLPEAHGPDRTTRDQKGPDGLTLRPQGWNSRSRACPCAMRPSRSTTACTGRSRRRSRAADCAPVSGSPPSDSSATSLGVSAAPRSAVRSSELVADGLVETPGPRRRSWRERLLAEPPNALMSLSELGRSRGLTASGARARARGRGRRRSTRPRPSRSRPALELLDLQRLRHARRHADLARPQPGSRCASCPHARGRRLRIGLAVRRARAPWQRARRAPTTRSRRGRRRSGQARAAGAASPARRSSSRRRSPCARTAGSSTWGARVYRADRYRFQRDAHAPPVQTERRKAPMRVTMAQRGTRCWSAPGVPSRRRLAAATPPAAKTARGVDESSRRRQNVKTDGFDGARARHAARGESPTTGDGPEAGDPGPQRGVR